MAQRSVHLAGSAKAGHNGGGVARQTEAFPAAALDLVAELHQTFDARRRQLLADRATRQQALDDGTQKLGFRSDTKAIRAGDWRVAAIPADLQRRRVEITGPCDPKMVINALNSGADVFMADFEDSTSPTWPNLLTGQLALHDAARKTLRFEDPTTKKQYALKEQTATLMFRPRGLHLPERHVLVDGEPVAGSFLDLATTLFHNAAVLLEQGRTPALYMPKLERMEEAALVDEVLSLIEERLQLPHGSVKVTVLIETLPAAFQMHEILHALKDRIVGLNCGRWDYIFSCIKRRREDKNFISPDRSEMSMDKGFLRNYSQLLIQTCHRRGAFAMGGMSAFIPVKNDPAKNDAAMAKVRADKVRESNDGHDGTWVAHPGLVEMALAIFDQRFAEMGDPRAGGARMNQLDVLRDGVTGEAVSGDEGVLTAALLELPAGQRTDAGLRHNLRVGVTYLAAWLDGNGCVPIDNLMEDAATAEIARAQIWQWHHHRALVDGQPLDAKRLQTALDEETAALGGSRLADAKELFLRLSTDDTLAEFLTLPAYDKLS